MESHLHPARQAMSGEVSIRVSAEQNSLIEHDGGVPNRWCAAEPGQDELCEEWLDREQQHRTAQHHGAEENDLATP